MSRDSIDTSLLTNTKELQQYLNDNEEEGMFKKLKNKIKSALPTRMIFTRIIYSSFIFVGYLANLKPVNCQRKCG